METFVSVKILGILAISLFAFLFFGKLSLLIYAKRYLKERPFLSEHFRLPNLKILSLSNTLILFSLGFAFMSLFYTKANQVESNQRKESVDILFLVDVSLSMEALDVPPSRLSRAKDILLSTAPDLVGNRLGIIAFAGSSFSFCPMTTDVSAFSDYVEALGVDLVAKKGTDMSQAFERASRMLDSDKIWKNRLIVLISDGEEQESSKPIPWQADLIVWGLGTEEGGLIRFGNPDLNTSGYVTQSGKLSQNPSDPDLIISKANFDYLNEIAARSNGKVYDLSFDNLGIGHFLNHIDSMKKNKSQLISQIQKEEGAGPFLAISAILFLLGLFFRMYHFTYLKHSLGAILILYAMSLSPVHAWELDPGGNRIKEGKEFFGEKKFKESKEAYQNAETYFKEDHRLKFNKADVEHELGQYDESIKLNQEVIEDQHSSPDTKAKALYNQGNSYFKKNDLKNAFKSYEQALRINPNHEPSKRNLEFLKQKSKAKQNSQRQDESSKQEEQKQSPKERNQQEQKPKNQERSDEQNTADKMMEQFDPNSILKKKPNYGGSSDNEKFW
ncbi:von Willebrand factor type A domain protein [Leptospira ryugenii]|uniref:von Willebrand factor type A domain protein n=1 Tax=Leptospira ryugenii TaxID=1917863 RepID=A0A2P2E4W6_9LEPT|nr:VWA domain-containing protein [Leptospira ryugenii]GBF51920.1 von Willebrand factor type A domain protein [Leptospira ryugenii]